MYDFVYNLMYIFLSVGMEEINKSNKTLDLVTLSKEELVKRLLETKTNQYNSDGLASILDDFFLDMGIGKLSLKTWDSRRKKVDRKHPKNDPATIHSQNSQCIDGTQKDVQFDPNQCILSVPKLAVPQEAFLYSSRNLFTHEQIKNCFKIWLDAKNVCDQSYKLWLLAQSDKAYGISLKKIGVGKWRRAKGWRYLLVVNPIQLELFYQNRYAKVVST